MLDTQTVHIEELTEGTLCSAGTIRTASIIESSINLDLEPIDGALWNTSVEDDKPMIDETNWGKIYSLSLIRIIGHAEKEA